MEVDDSRDKDQQVKKKWRYLKLWPGHKCLILVKTMGWNQEIGNFKHNTPRRVVTVEFGGAKKMPLAGLRTMHIAGASDAVQRETEQLVILGQQRQNERQGDEKEELMSHTHWWDIEKKIDRIVLESKWGGFFFCCFWVGVGLVLKHDLMQPTLVSNSLCI